MLVLVDSLEEVIDNIQEYQGAVYRSQKAVPAGVWHWYYMPPPIDQAGPSRFIGYKNMTAERYDGDEKDDHGYGVHGSKTQQALTKLNRFVEVHQGQEYYNKAYGAAARLLEPGKALQRNAKFYVPSAETDEQVGRFRREAGRRKYGPGGEGRDHRELKQWCNNNPEFFGLGKPRKVWFDEYSFLSGDRPDLLLEFENGVFAVIEIETRDPLPGVYQVIKYRALLAARKGLKIGTEDIIGCLVAWSFEQDVEDFAHEYGVRVYTKIL